LKERGKQTQKKTNRQNEPPQKKKRPVKRKEIGLGGLWSRCALHEHHHLGQTGKISFLSRLS
jgi:hypothetical protein